MRRAAFMAIATGLLAGGAWVYGQQEAQFPRLPPPGNILTGPNIGFRVDEMYQGKAIGKLVVRLQDGSWVEAQFGRPGVHPVGAK